MDIYRIAVRIALTNGMSPVLATISRDLLGVHAGVREIEKGFGRWALAIGGMSAVMAGSAIFGGMAKLAERGADVNHQLELMKLQSTNVADINAAAARAMEVSGSVLTSTYADNLKHIRELKFAFGDMPDALKYLEAVTKANATLNAMKGGGTDQVWELVKSLEQKGLTTKPEEFLSYIDQMTKAVVASGGKVTPAQFYSSFKYGRTAMLGWDETFTTQYLPRLIQSMSSGAGGGGSGGMGGPGNALMSAFAKVVQGQMPKTAAEEFARMGLAPGGIAHIKGSSETQITGGIAGKDLFQANPYAWVQKTLMPALAEHGITEQNRIIEEVAKMFPVRTASQIISEMALQGAYKLGDLSPFEKDARLQREAFDQRMAYDELIKNDYKTMMEAFDAQWRTFNQAIGAPLTEPGGPVTAVLADLTSLMHTVSAVAQAHPEAIRIVADALAALAASLVVGGLVALAAAIGPLVGAGAILVGLAAGLAALAALNWPSIKSALDSIKDWMHGHLPFLDYRVPDVPYGALSRTPGSVGAEPVTKQIEDWMHTHLPLLDYRLQVPSGALSRVPIPTGPEVPMLDKQSYLDIPVAPSPQKIAFDIGKPWISWPTPPISPAAAASSSSNDASARAPRLNVIPPPVAIKIQPVNVAINLDQRKIGEAQIDFIARQGAGPAEGAPYHDSTFSTAPIDFALA